MGIVYQPDAAGQGSLAEVPSLHLSCEKSSCSLSLVDGKLPELCLHCGYHIRSTKDSTWNNIYFVPRYLYRTWRGRATRKEYWSFILLMFIILILPRLLRGIAYDYFFIIYLIPIFLILPCIGFTVRSLNDVGFSSIWMIIDLMLFPVLFLITPNLNYFIIEDVFANNVGMCEFLSFASEITFSVDMLLYALIPNFVFGGLSELISLFFFVCFFIDSNKGTNKYGASRKYPMVVKA